VRLEEFEVEHCDILYANKAVDLRIFMPFDIVALNPWRGDKGRGGLYPSIISTHLKPSTLLGLPFLY
jgi:hypothetical protein